MVKRILVALTATALLAACSSQDTGSTSANTGGAVNSSSSSSARAGMPGSQEDLVANVGDRVFFDFDKSVLRPDGIATLERQAAWLAKYPQNSVQIAGNCDERGTEEYNIVLGQRRAFTASQFLQAHGVARTRMSIISYGTTRPTALGSDAAAWAQNRNAITSVQ